MNASVTTHPTRGGAFRRSCGLLAVLATKNLRLRFRGARLGFAWLLLQPIVQGGVIAAVFSRVAPSVTTQNYPLFVLSGILPWALTTRALLAATTAILDNAPLVKKVAVPRIVFPLAAVAATSAAGAMGILLLLPVSAASGTLSLRVALLPVAMAAHLVLVVPAGVLFSALYVRTRDTRFAVESSIVVAFYASPIIYPSDRLGRFEDLQKWNPITGVLSLYRASFTGSAIDGSAVLISLLFAAALTGVALAVFRRRAAEFADLV